MNRFNEELSGLGIVKMTQWPAGIFVKNANLMQNGFDSSLEHFTQLNIVGAMKKFKKKQNKNDGKTNFIYPVIITSTIEGIDLEV